MTRRSADARTTLSPFLPGLVLLLVASGCAALMYEMVWFQLLQLVIGSSAVSLGVLLGTFMGGMCLGSVALPRYIGVASHPLRVYATLELGIGAIGLLLLWGMPLVDRLYTTVGGAIGVRAVIAGVCLLPPTLLMGATLPALARSVETSRAGVSWLGFLYGGNIGGAVLGSLLAAFYLLRVYDVTVATCVAVALNVVVALISLRMAAGTPYVPAAFDARPAAVRAPHARLVYVAIALSGMTALGSQIIWTRLLSLVFGATVYAFSLILAVFLFGLGIGSTFGALLARRTVHPRVALGWCQMLLCGAMAWAGYLLTEALPYSAIDPAIRSDPWGNFRLDVVRCLWVVLPGAILWGASFPLAVAAVAAPGQDPGRLVGGVYAANTVGAIAGSLGVGLIAIAYAGSQHAQQALVVVAALSALLLLAPMTTTERTPTRSRWLRTVTVLVAAGLLAWRVAPVPDVLVAYGRYSAEWAGVTNISYAGEGLNAFVAVSRTASGVPIYHNAGKVQASSEGEDMRLQRLLGHLSHVIPRQPKRVLVIGLGAGITAGAVSIAPGVERMTVAEIEPLAATAICPYFRDYNYDVVNDPRVSLRFDDGRHVLSTTSEKFDVITSDLIDPWVKGTAALFTREFFELMKAHLEPGGVVTQFVQLYQSNAEAVKSEIGTFMEVFPNTIVWGNTVDGQGYDLVLTGQVEPMRLDIDELQARLDSPRYAEVSQSLRDIGISSAVELLSNYAASAADLAPWLEKAVINRDRNLRLQYLAGMSLNVFQSGPIYAEILQYAKPRAHPFTGSPASIDAVTRGIQRALGR